MNSDQTGHTLSLIKVFPVHREKAMVFNYVMDTQRWLESDWANARNDVLTATDISRQLINKFIFYEY